jgi:hypothetical protein
MNMVAWTVAVLVNLEDSLWINRDFQQTSLPALQVL